MKIEAKYQTIWNQYVREKKFYGYFELKQTKLSTFNLKLVKPHQIIGLLSAQESGFCWKLSDQDQREKPFDSFFTTPLTSYIIIKFPKAFYAIKIDTFLKEKENLTVERAEKIADRILII